MISLLSMQYLIPIIRWILTTINRRTTLDHPVTIVSIFTILVVKIYCLEQALEVKRFEEEGKFEIVWKSFFETRGFLLKEFNWPNKIVWLRLLNVLLEQLSSIHSSHRRSTIEHKLINYKIRQKVNFK